MTSVPGLWFDWTGAGFGTGANDDCTSLLMSATYSRGGTPEITGAAQVGQATFVLQNPNGLFDPDYAAGPLFGKLHDGIRVWFGCNEDGTLNDKGATVRGRFAGRIVDVSALPVPGAGDSTPTAEIVCEDALGWYGRTPVKLSTDCSPPAPPFYGEAMYFGGGPPANGSIPNGDYGGLSLWASDDGASWHQVLSKADMVAAGTSPDVGVVAPIPIGERIHQHWSLHYDWVDTRTGAQYYGGADFLGQWLVTGTVNLLFTETTWPGPPPGAHAVGDFVVVGVAGTPTYVYVCTVAGTPGTWALATDLWGGITWTMTQTGGTAYDTGAAAVLEPRADHFGSGANVFTAPFTLGIQWTVELPAI